MNKNQFYVNLFLYFQKSILVTLIILTVLGNSAYGQNDCNDKEYGLGKTLGIQGFFVRQHQGEVHFLTFNNSFVGNYFKGVIIDNKNKLKEQGNFGIFDKNKIVFDSLSNRDTFLISELSCKRLILSSISNRIDTVIYIRITDENIKHRYSSQQICIPNIKINSYIDVYWYLIKEYKSIGCIVTLFLGSILVLFWNLRNRNFIFWFIGLGITMTILFTTIIYSSSFGVSTLTWVLFWCDNPSKIYPIEFTYIDTVPITNRDTLNFWLKAVTYPAFVSFTCSLWFSWRKHIGRFKYKLAYFLFAPYYIVMIITPIILVANLFIGSVAVWGLGHPPYNWLIFFTTVFIFYFFYKRYIFKPWIEIDLPQIKRGISFILGGWLKQ